MEYRNELFQRLKPSCVALGRAAVALNGSRGHVTTISTELDNLRRTLSSATSTPETALDAKLAEYVFFPIAQLLKVSQKLSVNALELCLQCIAVLIDKGWRQDIPSNLAAQLVILCSLLAEKKPKGLSFSETTDDLQAWAFWCMYHLFSVIATNSDTTRLLRNESNFPQLGQTISTILDGIHDGGSVEVQVAATNALHALLANVADREVQASFLPGIVSKLTRVLTPQTKSRRNHTVLIGNIDTISMLLRNTMSDQQHLQSLEQDAVAARGDHNRKTIIDAQWQSAAAKQLKPALGNILRLKSHSRNDVQESIALLCLVVLENCQKTLANCSQMALETLVILSAEKSETSIPRDLQILAQTNSTISLLLQNQLYDWLQNLPTIAQGSDEQLKAARLEQVLTAYRILRETETNMDMIDRTLASTLRDCITVVIGMPEPTQDKLIKNDRVQSLDVSIIDGGASNIEFSSPLVKYRGQEDFFARVEKLVEATSGTAAPSGLAESQIRLLQQSQGEWRLANFWLLLTAIKVQLNRNFGFDDLLDIDGGSPSTLKEHLEELYAFSLGMLADSSDESPDPRMQSLALQGLALRAKEAGEQFRYELVDALYPVLHTLATPNSQLQQDGIAALNTFSSACGYASVEQLIVENVDYLTNAVALKLNAFDVSPQAPQVLLMMVKLSGPSLLPYLEDTIDSIFAALENYHGYPLLVELLFQVLSVVAEEGVRTPQLAITVADDAFEKVVDRWTPTTPGALTAMLREKATSSAEHEVLENHATESHLQAPWKEVNSGEDSENMGSNEEESRDIQMPDTELPPPAPKTYNLLLKINDLTQHFLPSSSASLRARLLSLIKTTIPALAQHEDSFLPSINTLWPEIVSRLDDDENYIVAAALDTIAMFCQYAGDFMRTRIIQIWPRLKEIHAAVANDIVQSASSHQSNALDLVHLKKALQRMQNSPSTYGDTGARLLCSSLSAAVSTIVQRTCPSPEMFDDALQMMEPMLEDPKVHAAFVSGNADAVWLYDLRRGVTAIPALPSAPQDVCWKFATAQG